MNRRVLKVAALGALLIGLGGVASAATISTSSSPAVPAVHLYAVTQTVMQNGISTLVRGFTTTFAVGGMVVETRDTIIVPATGIYEVSASLAFEIKGSTVPAATYETRLSVTGVQVRSWAVRTFSGWTPHHVLPSEAPEVGGTSLIKLAAGQRVQLKAWEGAGCLIGVGWNAFAMGKTANYLSLSWVGA